MRAIAAGAHVTTGSLYHHFSGKDELFVEVCAEGTRRLLDRLRSAARLTDGGTVADRLLGMFDAYVSFYLEERGYFDLLTYLQASPEQLSISPELAARVVTITTHFVSEMVALLARAEPRIAEDEVRRRVLFAVALAEGLVTCERRSLLAAFGQSLGAFRGIIRQVAERVVVGEIS